MQGGGVKCQTDSLSQTFEHKELIIDPVMRLHRCAQKRNLQIVPPMGRDERGLVSHSWEGYELAKYVNPHPTVVLSPAYRSVLSSP